MFISPISPISLFPKIPSQSLPLVTRSCILEKRPPLSQETAPPKSTKTAPPKRPPLKWLHDEAAFIFFCTKEVIRCAAKAVLNLIRLEVLNGGCDLSTGRIAEILGIGHTTAKVALRQLRSRGYIGITSRSGSTNIYMVEGEDTDRGGAVLAPINTNTKTNTNIKVSKHAYGKPINLDDIESGRTDDGYDLQETIKKEAEDAGWYDGDLVFADWAELTMSKNSKYTTNTKARWMKMFTAYLKRRVNTDKLNPPKLIK